MIQLNSVSFQWPQKHSPAVQDITFSLSSGSLLCICGSNGSGKSTLLQLLAGVQHICEGTYIMDEICCPGSESSLLKKTALLLQDVEIQLLGSTVKENLLLPWSNPKDEYKQKAYELASLFALEKYWNSSVHHLSHGQKQKLNIASALMLKPDLLLLDEPYSGLDYPATLQLSKILQQLGQKGLTRIISVHDLEQIIDITTNILILSEGKQVFFGSPKETLHMISKHPEWNIRLPSFWVQNASPQII